MIHPVRILKQKNFTPHQLMTTSELIIRGAIVGILLFSLARAIYLTAYAKGFRQGGEFVLEEWKKSHEHKENQGKDRV